MQGKAGLSITVSSDCPEAIILFSCSCDCMEVVNLHQRADSLRGQVEIISKPTETL